MKAIEEKYIKQRWGALKGGGIALLYVNVMSLRSHHWLIQHKNTQA